MLTTEDELVEALTDGQRGTILVEETPFYGTMGGQQADTGVIRIARTANLPWRIRSISRAAR